MRRTLAALAASAALLTTAACAESDPQPKQASSTAQATTAADEAAAAEPLTEQDFVQRLAAAQAKAGSAHVEMSTDLGGSPITARGVSRIAEKVEDAAAQLTMDFSGMSMELRAVEGVMYLNLGQLTGDKFAKVDLTDPKDPIVQQYGSMVDQIDPAAQLETFRDALVSFENQGDGGELDGVPTTKLLLVVDTAKITKGRDLSARGADIPKQLEYVLRVGTQDDLVRQISSDVAGTAMTVDWTRWGEPVEVEAPPASQITDSSLVSGLAGLAKGA